MFGKISIALQNNTDFGGNVDIAKSTFNRFGKISFRQRISNQLQTKYFKFFKKSFAICYKKLDLWFTDLFSIFINPKKVNVNPFDMFAFHSQLFHEDSHVCKSMGKNTLVSFCSIRLQGLFCKFKSQKSK